MEATTSNMFSYYEKAWQKGSIIAGYKVADMYKNGYYVNKSYEKYKEIIEKLYRKVKNVEQLDAPLPEVFMRLAKIRTEEGNTEEALRLYDYAKDFLAQRIQMHSSSENLNTMKQITNDIYQLREFDEEDIWLYDLYYLPKRPVLISFCFEGSEHEILAIMEDEGIAIRFDEKWFRTVDEFFQHASLDGELLTKLYSELYLFDVR